MTNCPLLSVQDKLWLEEVINRSMNEEELEFTCDLLSDKYSLISIAYILSESVS